MHSCSKLIINFSLVVIHQTNNFEMKKNKISSDSYFQNNWTKKLFIKHRYADNYVDEKTFLNLKRENG